MRAAAIKPDVSIVMGVYNGADNLSETLASISVQKDVSFECIVVDDGSTDQTPAVLDTWSQRDQRIRVFHQTNQGLTCALIRGCREAKGTFIARHDCGDRSSPMRLSAQRDWLELHDDAVVVGSAFRMFGPQGETLSRWRPKHSGNHLRQALLSASPSKMYGPHHGTVMFRKDAYLRCGGYRNEFYFAQDLDLWTRMAELGEISILDAELYEAEFTHSSISARQGARQRALRDLIAEATRLRREGRTELPVLLAAARIRPSGRRMDVSDNVAVDYFIGSCLASRRDYRASAYLWRVVKRRPYLLKAWAKIIQSALFFDDGGVE